MGSMCIVGASSKAYGKNSVSGKIIELQAEDREALAVLGRGVVGKALPAEPISDTARLMPLKEGKWTYRVLAGDHKGMNQEDIIARPKHEESGRSWRRVVGKKCIEYYRVRNGGKIEMASEVDLVEDVITRYAPVFPVIFNGMRPGEKNEVKTDIRVYDLHDPTDEKYKGHLKVTYTYGNGRVPATIEDAATKLVCCEMIASDDSYTLLDSGGSTSGIDLKSKYDSYKADVDKIIKMNRRVMYYLDGN